jgi:hypothetical protein
MAKPAPFLPQYCPALPVNVRSSPVNANSCGPSKLVSSNVTTQGRRQSALHASFTIVSNTSSPFNHIPVMALSNVNVHVTVASPASTRGAHGSPDFNTTKA